MGGHALGAWTFGRDVLASARLAAEQMNEIKIEGKLKLLSPGSLFDETTRGTVGSFLNGVGTETESLSVRRGFLTVLPAV